jgi:hypothetical protein
MVLKGRQLSSSSANYHNSSNIIQSATTPSCSHA